MQFKHIIQIESGVAMISWYLIEYFQHITILDVVLCKPAWKRDVFEGKPASWYS